jgi:hypothetical protein
MKDIRREVARASKAPETSAQPVAPRGV